MWGKEAVLEYSGNILRVLGFVMLRRRHADVIDLNAIVIVAA